MPPSRGRLVRARDVVHEIGTIGAARRAGLRFLRGIARAIDGIADRCEFRPHRPASALSAGSAKILAANAMLRDRHRGKRCFILGTGPSLSDEILKSLDGEIIIALNEAVIALGSGRTAATYGVMIDPFYFEGLPGMERLFADFAERAKDGGMSFIFDIRAHRAATAMQGFPPDRVFFLQQAGQLHDYARLGTRPLLDLAGALPGFATVSHAAIAVALYMGFSEIYLIGHDYSFVVAPEEAPPHFYGSSRYYPEPPSLTVALGGLPALHKAIANWLSCYELLARIGDETGQRIYNATPRSHLHVFPKVDLQQVLARTPDGLA